MSTRKKYTQEFKDEAVRLSYNSSGKTVKAVAESLGISEPLLHTWRRAKRDHSGKAFPGNGRARDEELDQLKKRLEQAEMERDILKKALGIFTPAGK